MNVYYLYDHGKYVGKANTLWGIRDIIGIDVKTSRKLIDGIHTAYDDRFKIIKKVYKKKYTRY